MVKAVYRKMLVDPFKGYNCICIQRNNLLYLDYPQSKICISHVSLSEEQLLLVFKGSKDHLVQMMPPDGVKIAQHSFNIPFSYF